MPNLVNEILLDSLKRDFASMGSCLVVAFDKLQPAQDLDIRNAMRSAGVRYRVVKNRLAQRAFADMSLDLGDAFQGKCGIAMADKEGAIGAAKALRETLKKHKESPIRITGGVIEGEVILGADALTIADMPDRQAIRTMLVSVLAAPARGLAVALSGLGSGMARCLSARIDAAGGEPAGGDAAGLPAPEAPAS